MDFFKKKKLYFTIDLKNWKFLSKSVNAVEKVGDSEKMYRTNLVVQKISHKKVPDRNFPLLLVHSQKWIERKQSINEGLFTSNVPCVETARDRANMHGIDITEHEIPSKKDPASFCSISNIWALAANLKPAAFTRLFLKTNFLNSLPGEKYQR